jgi:hypothetical protein
MLLVTAAAVACNEPPAPISAPSTAARAVTASSNASVGDQLGHLRSVIAPFQNIEAARGAEYTVPLTDCMVDPTLGGMGFHFGKGSAIDGTVNPLEPEALLYEPEKNGKLKLVAVEFLVPYDFASREGPAPRAFGLDFKQNDAFKVWALHAWIFKHNPSGMFADWNPNVNCDNAPVEARMSHGH